RFKKSLNIGEDPLHHTLKIASALNLFDLNGNGTADLFTGRNRRIGYGVRTLESSANNIQLSAASSAKLRIPVFLPAIWTKHDSPLYQLGHTTKFARWFGIPDTRIITYPGIGSVLDLASYLASTPD